MLVKFKIKNFALIRDVAFEPIKGLNIITGETGAGKSILFDALGLLLGNRAEAYIFEGNDDKCVLEAQFQLDEKVHLRFFQSNDFDFEKNTILRREITNNGKTRSFINDTPASLLQMKALGNLLLNIHNQHETIDIFNKQNQLRLLDGYAKNEDLLKAYSLVFNELKGVEKQLLEKSTALAELKKQEGYNQFLLDELEKLNLSENDNLLEGHIDQLANAEGLKDSGANVVNVMSGSEYNLLDQLAQLQSEFKKLSSFFPQQKFMERFQSLVLELKELSADIEKETDSLQLDKAKLDELETRFASIQQLLRKHQVLEIGNLLEIKESLSVEMSNTLDIEKEIAALTQQRAELTHQLKTAADTLSLSRKNVVLDITTKLTALLQSLELEKAKVQFQLTNSDNFSSTGLDDLTILFSANSDMQPQALDKVASGGEASRLALCLKSLATADNVTLIFDEIDSGVSGKVAKRIGELMQTIAEKQQVIAITHSPQVASCANRHIFVSKTEENGKTTTSLSYLNAEQEIKVIAQMLSGSTITDEALANAKILVGK